MKKTSITIGKYTLDYDGVRHYLITHSFIGWLIAKTIREKYNIPENLTSQEWLHRLLTEHGNLFTKAFPNQELNSGMVWAAQDAGERQVLLEVPKLSQLLKLDDKLLRIFILYGNVPYKINGPNLIHYASPLNPITDTGTYLKIDEGTTFEDVKSELTKAKQWQKIKATAADELGEKPKSKQIVKVRRKQIEAADESGVQDYLNIETEIISLFKEQSPDISHLTDDGYGMTLVEPAFEHVAGDSIDSDDDNEFDAQLKNKVKNLKSTYYTTTRRFSLPTPKDRKRIFQLIGM